MVAQKAKVLPPVLGDLRRHPVEKGQVHCSSFPCVFIGWTSAVSLTLPLRWCTLTWLDGRRASVDAMELAGTTSGCKKHVTWMIHRCAVKFSQAGGGSVVSIDD